MRPVIYHLIGTPAVGKYTIGKEIAALTGARFVDNHAIANVIFNLIAPDGVTPLPAEVWPRVAQVRAAVLDTLVNVSPPSLSFVFTNYIRGEDATEEAAFQQMVEVARARRSLFVPVLLRCETTELMNRAADDSRVQRMKLIDPLAIQRLNDEVPHFETDHPNALRLDVTKMPPADSARCIIDWANSLQAS